MKLPVFVVDAFTAKAFCGNPAAVCLLENVSTWFRGAVPDSRFILSQIFPTKKKNQTHLFDFGSCSLSNDISIVHV